MMAQVGAVHGYYTVHAGVNVKNFLFVLACINAQDFTTHDAMP